MKSILLPSKASNNNNQLVGSQIRRNESSVPNQHYLHHLSSNTTTPDNIAESIEKEHFNKLFSNSKKQVIRNRCSVKSDVDKLKRVATSDVCDGKNEYHPNADQKRSLKLKASGDNSFDYLENRPLISASESGAKISIVDSGGVGENQVKTVKLINLRKKNGTTLIFQKKTSAQKHHQRANEYRELESYNKKRRSLQQWPNTGFTNFTDTINNTNRHSWYESDYNPSSAIEEEFDETDPSLTQFPYEDNNLADNNSKHPALGSSGASSIENVPEIISMKSSIDGSATSRRWRIEQFLKNLVGKKPLVTSTPVVQKVKKSPSEHDLLDQQQALHQLQLNPDPTTQSVRGSIMSLNTERLLNKSTASLNSTSLSMVHQKLWSVVPLLNRKDGSSCSNLLSKDDEIRRNRMRKCETVLALTHEPLLHNHRVQQPSTSATKNHSKSINSLLEPIKPLNRLRNSKSCYVGHDSNFGDRQQECSRCSSLLSLSAIGSNNSLNVSNGAFVLKSCKRLHDSTTVLDEDVLDGGSSNNSSQNLIPNDINKIELYENSSNCNVRTSGLSRKLSSSKFTCKLCLVECSTDEKMTKISSCGCSFCTECMKAYVEFEISEGAYELSCPDALCNAQGVVSLVEISQLASTSLVAKHHRYRLNREVELDKNRLWCPNRNCETICTVGVLDKPSSSASSQQPSSSNATLLLPRSVLCPTCSLEFCSSCKKPWHPLISCEENARKSGGRNDSMMFFDSDLIKCCPMCAVPIEKDEGCAQMMCKRCKHVFCWYCLASLDDDFLLRHYDKGPCKNKLGHSRASVVWHRAQVIGIFAGFGILLLVASPLLLLAAPCIVCCKCKIEESTTASKLDVPMEDVRRTDHQV